MTQQFLNIQHNVYMYIYFVIAISGCQVID